MNILHQYNEIKNECNCRNKTPSIVYWGKIDPNPTTMTKFTLELQKNDSKIDSTTTPNRLHMKIMQMTQNCQKNTGTLKGTTLFQT